MKKVLYALLGLVVIVVAALFIVPPMIANSVIKPRVEAGIQDATGRQASIEDLSLSVLPSVSLQLKGLKIANAEGMPTPEMVSLGSVDLELALFPLIGKSVNLDKLVVTDLVVFLEVSEDGRQNWVFDTAAAQPETVESEPVGEGGGLPISGLSLGDVRIFNAKFSYIDLATGQTIEANDFNLKASLPNLEGKLALDGGVNVNNEAITLALAVDSPAGLLGGDPATVGAKIESALLQLNSDLSLQQNPQPAVNGTAGLNIGSVGNLLAWLQQPLPAEQPDPGPLNVAATFKTEGDKVVLEEAVISGDALDAKASGSFEQAGEKIVAALKLESGVLDIDRYLPPPAPGEPAARPDHEMKAGEKRGHPLEAIPDEPIDLTALRNVDADIEIAMGGIKAAGYEVGQIGFTAKMTGGVLDANLTELALYGGNVTGKVGLDASGEALGLDSQVDIDKVDLGKLSAVGAAGDPPVAGVASGSLTAKASGKSPRALVEALQGGLQFKLGNIDVKNAAAAALSGVDIALDLPGLSQPPTLKGEIVYNKQKVALDVALDPLDKILAGEAFALQADVASKLLSINYDGKVQQQPLPGLDGTFSLKSPSVGQLAAWAGQPLDKEQPDPGPLDIVAVLKAEGEKVVLEQATIKGRALDAQAAGSVDVSGDVKRIVLDVKAGMLDVDAYLPPPKPQEEAAETAEAEAAAPASAGGNPLDAIPDEPIDLTALRGTEADVSIELAGVRAVGFELGETKVKLVLKGGKLALEIPALQLYGGGITGRADLDGSGDALGLSTDFQIASLDVGSLALGAGVDPAPLTGIMDATLKAQATGKTPRALVQALSAEFGLQLANANLAAMPDAQIGALDAKLSLPAMDQATTGSLKVTLNGKPLDLNLDVNSPKKAMGGETFDLKLGVSSEILKASVDGAVQQQPLPGLNGDLGLDITSVAELAAWFGQALPADQPDPGPITLRANLVADGPKVAIKEATITGKESGGKPAAKATASGSFDGSGDVALFEGKVHVDRLDLNAFLPPPKEEEPAAEAETQASQGWSEDLIDASALRQAEGTLSLTTGEVLYREVIVQKAAAGLKLAGGVLNLTVNEVTLSPGQIAAAAVVDGSGGGVGVSYNVNLSGVEAKPFLSSFAGNDRLSGTLEFQTKGATSGLNQLQLVSVLNGEGSFKFLDGAFEGFDLAGTLRNAGNLGVSGGDGADQPKTDFTELSGSFTITNGVVQNRDLQMLAPLVRVSGAGDVPLPPQTLDYNVEAKLVASLEGQGGNDSLAGLPIPVHAHGPWSDLSYDIDWKSVFTNAALDPSRIANMPANLQDAAKGLGVALPGLGGGSEGGGGAVGEALQGVLGGGESSGEEGGSSGGIGGALDSILGGGAKTESQDSGSGPAPTTEEQKDDSGDPVEELGKKLKSLF